MIVIKSPGLPIVTLTVGELIAALEEYDLGKPVLFEWEGLRIGITDKDIQEMPEEKERNFPPYLAVNVDKFNHADTLRDTAMEQGL